MDSTHTKPKLVFFQFRYEENVPEFLLMHKREHVRCLSQFFDVSVINEDCDYQQICEKYEPDLVLFESGLEVQRAHRLKIGNIHSCPETPKVAFHNADGCSELRAGILSDMEHWGIETFFSISTCAAEHAPGIARNLFVWPNSIDPQTYRDYGESKVIPVLLTGSQSPRYPWRHKVYKLISERYPSLVCPHAGYVSRSAAGQMLYGEGYARTINASLFGASCGSVTKELVRKHLEIPGSKSCLVTEQSPGLEAAGFVDMTNCVFADENNVLEKLAYLFEHQDELAEITESGYQLVHARHTTIERDQIFQWFSLNKNLRPNQRIVQTNPFGPLTVVEKASEIENVHIISDGLHLKLLRRGEELFLAGRHEEAERVYLKCLNYLSETPEAKVRIGLCNLYRGNPRIALSWIVQPIQCSLARYKADDPDPVEWAFFIICLLCLGKPNEAIRRARQFPGLRHPELERTRWAITLLTSKVDTEPLLGLHGQTHRWSIHQIPDRSFKEWIEQLCIMLERCNQRGLAQTFRNYLQSDHLSVSQGAEGPGGLQDRSLITQEAYTHQHAPEKASLAIRRKPTLRRFDNPEVWDRIRRRLGKYCLDFLRQLEGKCGYFLPYGSSTKRDDEFFGAIRDLASKEDIKTALLIGVASGEGHAEAFAAGVLGKQSDSLVFCISCSGRRYRGLRETSKNEPFLHWYELSSSSPMELLDRIGKLVEDIKENRQIRFFDFILIKGLELSARSACTEALLREARRARILLLDGTDNSFSYSLYDAILQEPRFLLVAANPALRHGYAIFRREPSDIPGGRKDGTSLLLQNSSVGALAG